MFNIRENKLGMTFVEMVISLVILSILTTSTMGIIISSSNIFVSSSNSALDRQIGGYVFETLSSIIKYTTHMTIYDADKVPANSQAGGQSVSLNVTDNDTSSGQLLYKSKEGDAPINLYDEGFYSRRTISYKLEEAGSQHKHIKLTVSVYRDGQKRYELSRIIKCMNLALVSIGDDANYIKDNSTPGSTNQFIAFSVDEQLMSGGKNAYSLEYKISEYVAKYNRIQNEYTSKLQALYGYVNDKIGSTENKEGKRLPNAEYAELINLRDIAIFGNGSDNMTWEGDDPTEYLNLRQHYQERIKDLLKFVPAAAITGSNAEDNPFYGVVATKEELYAGFILTYYDANKDGKVTKAEYPQFTDPNSFFAGTSMASYIKNTSKTRGKENQMVIMAYYRDNIAENFTTLFSSKPLTVYTYSGDVAEGYMGSTWVAYNASNTSISTISSKFTDALKKYMKTIDESVPTVANKDEYAYKTIDTATVSYYYHYYYKQNSVPAEANHNLGVYQESNASLTQPRGYTGAEATAKQIINDTGATQVTNDGKNYYLYVNTTNNKRALYIYPLVDMTEGWYYVKNGDQYHFFFLKADESELNPGKIAVAAQNQISSYNSTTTKNIYGQTTTKDKSIADRAASYAGNARVIVSTNNSYRVDSIAYAQARYGMMEQGGSSSKQTTLDSVQVHQYTDYIVYGVDWNTWFVSSPDGLVNKIMKGTLDILNWIFRGKTLSNDINSISGDNAVQSLGNKGKYTTTKFNGETRSYNMAWTVYNPKRGTWYYVPAASTRLSNATSNISWSSNKDQPVPLDVDLRAGSWRSSSALVSDIDQRKMSSSGLFGLVDTTQDVLWVGLPTGNQVEVTFE